jgi:hypothetical protein
MIAYLCKTKEINNMTTQTWYKIGFNQYLKYKHTTKTGKLAGFLVIVSGKLDNPYGLVTRNVTQKFIGSIVEATESQVEILEDLLAESLVD